MPEVNRIPKELRPFLSLGLDLDWSRSEQATGACPFCADEKGFSVALDTSKWQCWDCKSAGNSGSFVVQLWEASDARTGPADYEALRADRGLLETDTVMHWGACKSIVTGEWLVPGYNHERKLVTLYRWEVPPGGKKRVLQATAGLPHGLFMPSLQWNPKRDRCEVLEGAWDGMAAWELLKDRNVCAVPGASSFAERWCPLFAGKSVTLWFDNDHPKEPANGKPAVSGAGLLGAHKTTVTLAGAKEPPVEIRWLKWGEQGHDPQLPSGHDLRDWFSSQGTVEGREARLKELAERIEAVPQEWLDEATKVKAKAREIQLIDCRSWRTLENACRTALLWRRDLSDVFSTMLAVALSTSQEGDQLFLQVIGDAGSAKTRLCDAMLTSPHCFALEHLTGFHSGWKDAEGNDYSLLSRINHKTLITPEGDVLMASPKFSEIMSQQRRIFDGASGASYKNRKEDLRWVGLRTPWIIAGTPALLNMNQARLGDRFLKVMIDQPSDEEKRSILRRVGHSAWDSAARTSNGDPTSILEARMREMYQLTGGFVGYLRENAGRLIEGIHLTQEEVEHVEDRCADFADFTALVRARPDAAKEEKHDSKELPSRLHSQFMRLTRCLCVVLGKKVPDDDVLRRVKKVAMDTARGRSMKIVKTLHEAGITGTNAGALEVWTGDVGAKDRELLKFLSRIKVCEAFRVEGQSEVRWRLRPRMVGLCDRLLTKKPAGS